MIDRQERIRAFAALGGLLKEFSSSPDSDKFTHHREKITLAYHKNGWFTEEEVFFALRYWADSLDDQILENWQSNYTLPSDQMRVGLILAGNIPLVGFHDILCTILAGHTAVIKPSSSDDVLIPWIMDKLVDAYPASKDWFVIHDNLMKEYDAVIATGSNNSARYFEQYFGHLPHIIRRNRTSIAVLNGNESKGELNGLMQDALQYFGLGCRNVTKLFVPEDSDLNEIFAASVPFSNVMQNKKYANNYAYHRTLLMMQGKEILENDVILLTPEESLFSPVSVLHYQRYKNDVELKQSIASHGDDLQCIVGQEHTPFSTAQKPGLDDYADGVDTMRFLCNLKAS